jgi:hypothetical protein
MPVIITNQLTIHQQRTLTRSASFETAIVTKAQRITEILARLSPSRHPGGTAHRRFYLAADVSRSPAGREFTATGNLPPDHAGARKRLRRALSGTQ